MSLVEGKKEENFEFMLNFPCLIMILWMCRKMYLFLQNNMLKYLALKCNNCNNVCNHLKFRNKRVHMGVYMGV